MLPKPFQHETLVLVERKPEIRGSTPYRLPQQPYNKLLRQLRQLTEPHHEQEEQLITFRLNTEFQRAVLRLV